MFALIQNGAVLRYPYTLTDLRRDNPNVSFPNNITDDQLLEFGVCRVYFSTLPEIDVASQVIVEDAPTFNNGRWEQVFSVRNKTAEEIKKEYDFKAAEVREERNRRIATLDWTQGKDIPDSISAPAAIVRQALRDVPSQAGFPWEVQWPDDPQ